MFSVQFIKKLLIKYLLSFLSWFKCLLANIPKPLIYISIFSFLYRLIGLNYGLPLELNVDEPALISTTLQLDDNLLNPNRFDWPSLYFYINAVLYGIFILFRNITGIIISWPELFYSVQIYFYLSRALSVLFAALTVIAIYFLSKKVYKSEKVAYISAIIVTFIPVHVYESNFAKLDIALTFFITIILYLLFTVYKFGRTIDYCLVGIFLGLSISIKYNAAVLVLPLFLAYLLKKFEDKQFIPTFLEIKKFVFAGIITLLMFFVGTPYALIDFNRFFSTERGIGALWQFDNVGKIPWEEYQFAFIDRMFFSFTNELGVLIWALFMFVSVLFLFFNRRSVADIFFLFPSILLILYFISFRRSPQHYYLIILPFIIPVIASFLCEINEFLYKLISKLVKIDKNKLLLVSVVIVMVPTIISSALINIKFANKDTRNIAYEWVQKNLDEEFLFVYGGDVEMVSFKDSKTVRVNLVDKVQVRDVRTPFYILLAAHGLESKHILDYPYDSGVIPGDKRPFFENATIVFSTDNYLRYGPPIFIIRVDKVSE